MSGHSTIEGHRCVIIADLRLPFSIGIHAHEKKRPQEVVINVRMYVPERGPATSTDIKDYVSYSDIVHGIREISRSGRHILLVETLAEEIAAIALADRRVARVQVDVRKSQIVPEAEGVGVAIERLNDGR